jgi:integrase/recombinase XerD
MTLDYVSIENSKYHHEWRPPDLHQPRPPRASPPLVNHNTKLADETRVTHTAINRILHEVSVNGFCDEGHVKDYMVDLHRRNCRRNTIKSNGCTIILFLRFLNSIGRNHLETVTRNDLSAFIEHEQDRGMKPNSVRRYLGVLSAFFTFLIERDAVHPDVLKRKMRVKVPEALPRAIDPEDIKQLLSVIKKPRDRAMILILVRTGMRIGEVLSTTLEDVNLAEKRIEIFEAHKNRVGRVVYISDDARRALKRWIALRDPQQHYLFYGRQGRPLCYEAARTMFTKYLDKAGLSHKGYTLHCLRHTFASELLNAGMRLECLQQLLGHSSIEMTRRYARLTDTTRKEEYFRAMAIIEKGGINGHYRCDYQLP